MKEVKIGKITLSFTFISLGIVIFIEKFSHYKWIDLFPVLWPAIIIFFGLEVVYSFLYAKKENNKSSQLDTVSVLLVSLLLLTMGMGTSVVSKYPNMKRAISKQLKYKYREDISEQITLNKGETRKLIIKDLNTDIIVNRSTNKEIEVRLEGIYRDNKKRSNRHLKIINIESYGGVTRISKFIGNRRDNIKKINTENMRYLIYLPENIDIEVISKYGDVFLDLKSNTSNNIDIRCDYGDVSMIFPREQIGKFNIITTYGSIHDELEFDIIESISAVTIDETRKSSKPNFDIRVNNGDVILKTD